jgi:hypothetical protein
MLVCLNRLVIFLIVWLWYVKVVHFVSLVFRVCVCVLFSILVLSFLIVWMGKWLLLAVALMVLHSVSFLACVSGSVVIRVIMCL